MAVTNELGFAGKTEIHIDSEHSVVLAPPALDFFLAGIHDESRLSSEVLQSPILLEQAAERRTLVHNLRSYYEKARSVHESGEEVAGILNGLTDFISKDSNNGRILLYLPFELLPNVKSTNQKDESLVQAETRFAGAYKDVWIRLLHESDVRASFVDGDVREPGLGEPPRVRKAGHLLPELLDRGIVMQSDVIDLLQVSDEDELLQSLTEGVIVSMDRGLIDEESVQAIKKIGQSKPIIESILSRSVSSDEQALDIPEGQGGISVERVIRHLSLELHVIDASYTSASISQKRLIWEKGMKRSKVFERHAKEIVRRLEAGMIEIDDLVGAVRQKDNHVERALLFVHSMRELFAPTAVPVFESLWKEGNGEVRDAITVNLNQWAHKGIVSGSELEKFDIHPIDLSSPFPVDLEKYASGEGKVLLDIAKKIGETSALTEYIYPIVLAIGSRVKGYAAIGADTDAAIFFKPETPIEKREEVLRLLKESVPEIVKLDSLLEFWTSSDEGKLGLRYLPNIADTIVGALQIHMLLGGIWIGKSDDLHRIYADITTKYADLRRFGEEKEDARFQLIHQLELDMLQYRLMHKGYRRQYASERSVGTLHSEQIDWESDFWDPGYRRIASLLFLSRVFLPDISK